MIDNPVNVHYNHVLDIREHLLGKKVHPCFEAEAGLHTSWVIAKIIGEI